MHRSCGGALLTLFQITRRSPVILTLGFTMSPQTAIAILAVAVVAVIYVQWARFRIKDREVLNRYPVGYKGLFVGLLIPHWEVGRFVWFVDGANTEQWGSPGNCCRLVVDEGVFASAGVEMNNGRTGAPAQHISFQGEILDIGAFGHLGICRYRIRVLCDLVKTGDA